MNREDSLARLVFAGVLLLLAQVSSAEVLAGPVVSPVNGHSYYLLDTSSWTVAENEAVSLGGHLATIRNQAENDWIVATFGRYGGVDRFLWIGLNDATLNPPNHYDVWASGEPVGYMNWASGEPNHLGLQEFWVEVFPVDQPRGGIFPPVYAGQWNDVPNVSHPFESEAPGSFGPVYGVAEVAEVVPLPSAAWMVLVGLGGLAVLRLVRRR